MAAVISSIWSKLTSRPWRSSALVMRRACGAWAATLSAVASVSSISRSCGTTRLTMPQRSAVAASIGSAVNSISAARA